MSYKEKYLKYKNKYIELKNQIGGDVDLNGLKYVIYNKTYQFKIDNIDYIVWYNDNYKTLYIQNYENYNGDNTIDPDIRIKNKLNIIVNDQYNFTECFEGDFPAKEIFKQIPVNWHGIVNTLIKICKINILLTTLDESPINDILNIPDELYNASKITIDYYNKMMKYLSKLNIHESIDLDDIDMNLYMNILFSLDIDNIETFINMINEHAQLSDATYEPLNMFYVGANGTMATVIKSLLNRNNIIYDIINLIVLCYKNHKLNIDIEIVKFYNQFTSGMFIHSLYTQGSQSRPFITKEKKQNFLQWFIMSMNPLSFFVPANSLHKIELTVQNILDNMKKCLIFYSVLHLFIKSKKIDTPNYMQRILFTPYSDDIDFNIIIEKIQKEQLNCHLSKFPDSGDGFLSTPDEMLEMRFLNEYYGHKFLDPRHLITILTGSQNFQEYRKELRDIIPKLLEQLEKLKESDIDKYVLYKLQYFSRLKLARFEPIKLGDCIDRIKLDGMYLLTQTSLNNNLSDDDIKMATYFFNKYENSDNTIRCKPDYFYLNYDDITYNKNKFSIIIKILQSNEMHFILYSHNEIVNIEIEIDSKKLYDYIYHQINITNINKTLSKPI